MKIEFRNETSKTLNVVVEPWADELPLKIDQRATLSIPRDDVDSLTIVSSEGYLSVFLEDERVTSYSFELT